MRTRNTNARVRLSRRLGVVGLALCLTAAVGCRQDMHDQAKYEALEASTFYADGKSARDLVPNTVPRGFLRADNAYYTGLDGSGQGVSGFPVQTLRKNWVGSVEDLSGPDFTRIVLRRGQQRYGMFCTPCHGRTGAGNGMIVQRGFQVPTSFHDERLRNSPPGYIFNVMTEGFGQMSSYARQITPEDRWAIAAYVQTLQFSQSARSADLNPGDFQRLAEPPEADGHGAGGHDADEHGGAEHGGAEHGGAEHGGDDANADDHENDAQAGVPAGGVMSQSSIDLTAENFQAPKSLDRIQLVALVVGVVGLAASVFGYMQNPDQFFRSYLKAYVFWLSIPLGCLGFLMLQHLSQGAWGLIPRRLNEAAAATLLLLAPLFIPIWFGLTNIFAWARPEVMEENYLIAKKAWYLDPEFFLLRVVIYFAVWLLLTFALRRQSNRQDRGATVQQIHTMRTISGPGLVVFVALATFVAVDFLMSIDAEYYSSIYGAYFLISCAIAGMAFLILMESHLVQREPMAPVLTKRLFHDQGKLLLAFTMVWAYFSVSQFLITWQGNLPEEVKWYEHRFAGGWDIVAIALALTHFALPFLLLLSRPLKRNSRTLAVVAVLLLAVHWMDYQWQVAPHFHHHATVSWIDFATLAGIGGLWLWFFVLLFKRRPILSYNDPYLPEALDHA